MTDSAQSGVFTYAGFLRRAHQVNLLGLAGGGQPALRREPARTRRRPTHPGKHLRARICKLSANGIVDSNVRRTTTTTRMTLTLFSPTGLDERNFYTGRIDYNLNREEPLLAGLRLTIFTADSGLSEQRRAGLPGTGTALGNDFAQWARAATVSTARSLAFALITPNADERIARRPQRRHSALLRRSLRPGMSRPWKGYNPSFGIPERTLSGSSTTTCGRNAATRR